MSFIHDNFLLETKTAQRLFHQYAAPQPIIDYHCHLPPKDVAADRRFANLFEIWLEGDHYKWRAMRASGVPERFCTGDASPREKFQAWAKTVPHTLRNPLYHWTHLELKRYFGIDELLDEKTADSVWDRANEALQSPQLSAKGILRQVLRQGGLHHRRSRGSAHLSRADCRIRPADEDLSDVPRRSRDGSASAGCVQCVDRQARADGGRSHREAQRPSRRLCAGGIRRFTTSADDCRTTASTSAMRPTARMVKRRRFSPRRAAGSPQPRASARRLRRT